MGFVMVRLACNALFVSRIVVVSGSFTTGDCMLTGIDDIILRHCWPIVTQLGDVILLLLCKPVWQPEVPGVNIVTSLGRPIAILIIMLSTETRPLPTCS